MHVKWPSVSDGISWPNHRHLHGIRELPGEHVIAVTNRLMLCR